VELEHAARPGLATGIFIPLQTTPGAGATVTASNGLPASTTSRGLQYDRETAGSRSLRLRVQDNGRGLWIESIWPDRLATGDCAAEVGPGEVGAEEVGVDEAGVGEVGVGEVGVGEVGVDKGGVREVGAAEAGAAEAGAGEVGAGEVGVDKGGVREVGAGEVGFEEAGPFEVGVAEAGVGEVGAREGNYVWDGGQSDLPHRGIAEQRPCVPRQVAVRG
jgi:hypothetical protein